MRKWTLLLILGVWGCEPPDATPDPEPDPEPDPCEALVDLSESEANFETLTGFSGSEDFAFDDQGNLVSVDQNGNLTRQPREGEAQLIAAGFGDTAGLRLLPGGDAILANVSEGSLMRITPQGAQSTILSGIAYPNGVEVDMNGMVFVAEHDAGRVREVNPDTGDFDVVADGLFNPNGVSLSPDGERLYIGSFGGGTLHYIEREDDGWTAPVLLSQVSPGFGGGPGEPPPAFCEEEGETCTSDFGTPGFCDAIGQCALNDPTPCANVGDACTSGGGLETTCVEQFDGSFICPNVPAERVLACEGANEGDPCEGGTCFAAFPDFEGGDFMVCFSNGGGFENVCDGLNEGDPCNDFGGRGLCSDGSEFGLDEIVCIPEWINDELSCEGLNIGDACSPAGTDGGGSCTNGFDLGLPDGVYCAPEFGFEEQTGGLDGVEVDICGNVYVTEFTTGKIFRVPPDGGEPEVLVTLPSSWIPNMHWGYGLGEFREDRLYVMDRDEGRLFEIETGVPGSGTLFGSEL